MIYANQIGLRQTHHDDRAQDNAPDSIRVLHPRPVDGTGAARIQAVILAAGRGRRLSQVIDHQPKCLAEIGGRSLIDHQLEMLAHAGITQVMVVTGYRADVVRRVVGRRARFVHNPLWEDTEGLFSLYLCHDWVTGPLLAMNCDVLLHPEVLRRLVARPGNTFAYDSSSGADPEQMAVEFDGERLVAMRKDLPEDRTHGENVGILYFDPRAARLMFRAAASLLQASAMRKRLASAVQMVARRFPISGIDVADLSWIEIDFPEDLERARSSVWPAICEPQLLTEPQLAASA